MGKVRTRILGLEDLEEAQKEEQKKRSAEKKAEKNKDAEAEIETEAAEDAGEKKQSKKSEEAPAPKKKLGKKHSAALKKVDGTKAYTLEEAVKLLKEIKYAGFDESVELHLNVEKTGSKGEVELPHSTGKTVRIAIVDDQVLANIEKGVLDFDILIAHPSYMPKLAKFAKVLGPKGLMPNPKAGTVSPNPEEVAKKFAKGSLRWKTEPKFPLIHQMIAKISFDEGAILDNARALIGSVGKANIDAAFIKTTMSPGLKIDLDRV